MNDTRTGIWVGPDCTCAECQTLDRQTHGVDMIVRVTEGDSIEAFGSANRRSVSHRDAGARQV